MPQYEVPFTFEVRGRVLVEVPDDVDPNEFEQEAGDTVAPLIHNMVGEDFDSIDAMFSRIEQDHNVIENTDHKFEVIDAVVEYDDITEEM